MVTDSILSSCEGRFGEGRHITSWGGGNHGNC